MLFFVFVGTYVMAYYEGEQVHQKGESLFMFSLVVVRYSE